MSTSTLKKYNKPIMSKLGNLIKITHGTGSKPGDAGNLVVKTGGGN